MTYKESLDDLIHIVQVAGNFSITTTNIEVDNWRKAYGSWIFAKLCSHSISFLRIESSLHNSIYNIPIPFDISSLAVLARTIIDTYYVFFYVALDKCGEFESEFRRLLWVYQGEKQRMKMLNLIGSTNPQLAQLNNQLEKLKHELVNKLYYRLLTNNDLKRNIRKGNTGLLFNHTELSQKAGIDPNYYKSEYDYLSTYIHSTAYSINQLIRFRPSDLELVKPMIEVVTGYMCYAVNDFVELLKELNLSLDNRTNELIQDWKYIFKNFGSN